MQTRYKAIYPAGPSHFELRDVEPPATLRPGYFMGNVDYCAICGSDRGMWRGGLKNTVLGHEFSVTVIDQGDSDLKQGDRVSMYPGVPCWECDSCRSGRDNICSSLYRRDYSGINADGGFAQKYTGPAAYAVKIPDHVSSQAASLNEPLATAVHAVRKSGLKLGDKVLVIGAGIIGLCCAELAKKAGASQVIITEYNPKRLAFAKSVGGLDGYIEASDSDLNEKLINVSGGFDMVFECAASGEGYATAVKVLKPGCNIIMVGQSPNAIGIVLQSFIMKEIGIIPSMGYTFDEFKQSMGLIADGLIDPCKYVTKIIPLEETQAAFEMLFENPNNDDVKILVKPS